MTKANVKNLTASMTLMLIDRAKPKQAQKQVKTKITKCINKTKAPAKAKQVINKEKVIVVSDSQQISELSTASKISSEQSASNNQAQVKKRVDRKVKKAKIVKKDFIAKPQRAYTPYICFTSANFCQIKAQCPDQKTPEIMKGLAQMWVQMTDEEKIPYKQLHEQDVDRYNRELNDLNTQGYFINKKGVDSRTIRPKVKRAQQLLAKGVFVPPSKPVVQPKRPIPAYMHWSTRNMKVLMAAEPGLKMIDSNKRSGLTWNSWGETEKAPYRAYKEEDVKRYERELKQLADEGYFIDKYGIKSCDRIGRKHKYPAGTKFPPNASSEYQIFVQENLEAICEQLGIDKKQGKEICEGDWEILGEEERQEYADKRKEQKERRRKQMIELQNYGYFTKIDGTKSTD